MLLFSLCTFLLIVAIIVVLERAHLHHKHATDDQYMYVPQRPSSAYRVRNSVLGTSEMRLYEELERQISPHNHIFTKMRIADVIQTTNGNRYMTKRNSVTQKHFDFLITNADYHPLIAIELNGGSHHREDRQRSDEQKKYICEEAGLPLETIQIGTRFADDVARLVSAYKLH